MKHKNHKAKVWADDGQDTGATFAVEVVGGVTTLRYDSRGTTAGTRAYRAGLVLLFGRLAELGVELRDACVETRTTKDLSRLQRRLKLTGRSWPLDLAAEDPETLRAAFGTAAARVGRPPNAKGGGNGTKRLRLYLDGGAASWDVPALEHALAGEPSQKGRRTA
jgi:hypothetical protein